MDASPATIRRDLERLVTAGLITRVRGGATLSEHGRKAPAVGGAHNGAGHRVGVPFHENIHRHLPQKRGDWPRGRPTLQRWRGSDDRRRFDDIADVPPPDWAQSATPHQFTAHRQRAIAPAGTQLLVPAVQIFPEQNIILSAAGDDGMPRFHAPKLFMGTASLGPAGLMQADVILVTAERRLIGKRVTVLAITHIVSLKISVWR